MLCTSSGRLLARLSCRCLLMSKEGEKGPRLPLLAAIHRDRMSLARAPDD